MWPKMGSVVTKLTEGGPGLRFPRDLVKHRAQQPLTFLEVMNIGYMEAYV